MADPWQQCMDYAVTLARKAGEVCKLTYKLLSRETHVCLLGEFYFKFAQIFHLYILSKKTHKLA